MRNQPAGKAAPIVYEIRVEGCLPDRWRDWFEGLSFTREGGETLLTGPVVDQAALYGLLRKVRDTGLTLVAVNQVRSKRK
jgi:hypothetical protein